MAPMLNIILNGIMTSMNIEVISSIILLWVGLFALWYFYKRIHYPFIRLLEFDKSAKTVQLLLTHHMNRVPMWLTSSDQAFEFENHEYLWTSVPNSDNQVYILSINKNGRFKEIFRIDFINHKIELEHAI